MKKLLALVLALTMVLALAACGGSSETETPAAEAAPAAPAAPAAGDDLAGWKAYLEEYAKAGAPTEADAQSVISQIEAAGSAAEVEAISELTVLFENVGVLTYDAWIAAGKPAAQAAGIGTEADKQSGAASGEPGEASGEPSGEAGGDVPQSSAMANGAHGGTPGATSEADYQAYLKAWLDYENSVNDTMTDESEAEFLALVNAGNYTDFPAEMLFSGMLVTGAAMTYDEFVAANGVY